MLFIYGALGLGGVETFFVRMAKERASKGKRTILLLLKPRKYCSEELILEIAQYSEVLFYNDVFYGGKLSGLFPLLAPIKKSFKDKYLVHIKQIHGFSGKHVLLGYRFSSLLNLSVPVSVGFYHYIQYAWKTSQITYSERINRDFVFKYLPSDNLMFFSEQCKIFNEIKSNLKFPNSHTFRLGVVDKQSVNISSNVNNPLRVVAVGRLVSFKSYNLFMLDVVKELNDKGLSVMIDIYGKGELEGEMRKKITKLNIEKYVNIKGNLNYSDFNSIIKNYDLFIGSGTAIIQSASLGVPSIVGIENLHEAKTYGYFSNVYMYEYNLKGLDLKLYNISKLIEQYMRMESDDVIKLKQDHVRSVENFTNEICEYNFSKLDENKMPEYNFKYSKFKYELSWLLDLVNRAVNKNHPYTKRHEESVDSE